MRSFVLNLFSIMAVILIEFWGFFQTKRNFISWVSRTIWFFFCCRKCVFEELRRKIFFIVLEVLFSILSFRLKLKKLSNFDPFAENRNQQLFLFSLKLAHLRRQHIHRKSMHFKLEYSQQRRWGKKTTHLKNKNQNS